MLPELWPTVRCQRAGICVEGHGRSVDFLDGGAAPGLGYIAEVLTDTRLRLVSWRHG